MTQKKASYCYSNQKDEAPRFEKTRPKKGSLRLKKAGRGRDEQTDGRVRKEK